MWENRKMFIDSKELLSRIKSITDEIFLKTNGIVVFEEYILVPYYGFIILRFNIKKDDFSLGDLDSYEAIMYECVKDEFLIDFMGSVYKKVGLNLHEIDQIFRRCLDIYCNEKIFTLSYAERIDIDAKFLLELCNLDKELDVWEIQVDEDILLFIMKDKFEKLGIYKSGGLTIHVFYIDKMQCEGLVKAIFYAKRNKISLVRVLLEA